MGNVEALLGSISRNERAGLVDVRMTTALQAFLDNKIQCENEPSENGPWKSLQFKIQVDLSVLNLEQHFADQLTN